MTDDGCGVCMGVLPGYVRARGPPVPVRGPPVPVPSCGCRAAGRGVDSRCRLEAYARGRGMGGKAKGEARADTQELVNWSLEGTGAEGERHMPLLMTLAARCD